MTAHRALAALVVTFAISVAGIPAAWCQATPGTAPAGAAVTQAPKSEAPATQSSACRKAKSKIAREQRTIDKVQRAIQRARDGSAKCTTKPVCDKYATKIEELESRRAHHAARLTRLEAAGNSACGPG
ncbi:MAG TPA: hypothetical protein VF428_06355 [Casimicrobiaceae bacterium]